MHNLFLTTYTYSNEHIILVYLDYISYSSCHLIFFLAITWIRSHCIFCLNCNHGTPPFINICLLNVLFDNNKLSWSYWWRGMMTSLRRFLILMPKRYCYYLEKKKLVWGSGVVSCPLYLLLLHNCFYAFFLQPEDWDEEEDGEWMAPTIPNPEYKGPWKPKVYRAPHSSKNLH